MTSQQLITPGSLVVINNKRLATRSPPSTKRLRPPLTNLFYIKLRHVHHHRSDNMTTDDVILPADAGSMVGMGPVP